MTDEIARATVALLALLALLALFWRSSGRPSAQLRRRASKHQGRSSASHVPAATGRELPAEDHCSGAARHGQSGRRLSVQAAAPAHAVVMALWPFGKRKNRAFRRSDGASSPSSAQRAASFSCTAKSESSIPNHNASATPVKTHRRDSKRRKNRRDQGAIGGEDSCLPPRQITTPSPVPSPDLDTSPSFHFSALARPERVDSPSVRTFSPFRFQPSLNMSQNSLSRSFNDVPTLRSQRRSTEPSLLRRKSSKRKRNDYAREQEIRNMALESNWDLPPGRAQTDLRASRPKYERLRSISPDSHAYKLSVFDALSPRPVLRYARTPRYVDPSRSAASKSKCRALRLGDLDGEHRINELADDMDAGTLRELMERDRRRRAARRTACPTVKLENPPKPQSFTVNANDEVHEKKPTVEETQIVVDDEKSFVHVSAIDAAADIKHELAGQEMGSVSDISPTQKSEKRLSSNAGRIGRSLSSFFRRGSRFKREPQGQPKEGPSFSVPSRESFSRISHTEVAGMPPAIPKKSSLRFDGQSMQSRFTEHFDEPMDNMRSPTAIDIYPTSHRFSVCTGRGTVATAPIEAQDTFRASGANSPDTRPNSIFLAQSLASIDSEGSWLSGKPSRHLSQARLAQYRGSAESKDDPTESSPEERPASDEILGPLSIPVPEEEEEFEIPISGNAKPQDNDGTTWHDSVGKRPRLIRPCTRAKSKEGLFTEFLESASEVDTPSDDSPLDIEAEMEVHRATSVDLGKGHTRHISAGSAKLLDLSSRLSEDRRPSSGTFSSGVLPSPPLSQ
ncbi:hypothetical protein CIRG_08406 [Coccidioides immitis RMSCC 2394]|uniref:Uncharacterized protein n=1 Tax=Coccidioides immitis RMSCC 2394 TaxID=404692 RepID=A0A0J6YM13_COCIT|nr:hypothetical protein CIRG_08406 [Coccidioides immitis RMSCC 2394]